MDDQKVGPSDIIKFKYVLKAKKLSDKELDLLDSSDDGEICRINVKDNLLKNISSSDANCDDEPVANLVGVQNTTEMLLDWNNFYKKSYILLEFKNYCYSSPKEIIPLIISI